MTFHHALFIFRRDLRLQDNVGLHEALRMSERVTPCFIFDPRQVGKQNDYRSDAAVRFMGESLRELADAVRERGGSCRFFHGKAEDVVGRLAKDGRVDAVFFNQDYTPFARERDAAIQDACTKHGVACRTFHDALLNPPDAVKTAAGTPYGVFTAYFNKAQKIPVSPPKALGSGEFAKTFPTTTVDADAKDFLPTHAPTTHAAGRTAGKKILHGLAAFAGYAKERDLVAEDGTTALSPHHKFGTVSVRETYWAVRQQLGPSHPLIRQLYWRDFFTQVAFHDPGVFGHAYHRAYDRVKWEQNHAHFTAWCEGKTGFPLIDAGMRQLNETGWMHNRARMAVASFLVKDLHVDWREGEKYFASKLVDYDPAVNNGNWQWAASTGCDAQPYFRVFNPWLQQKKFDPDAAYIRHWVPELAGLSAKEIHALEKKRPEGLVYSEPIVDHAVERTKAIVAYKTALAKRLP